MCPSVASGEHVRLQPGLCDGVGAVGVVDDLGAVVVHLFIVLKKHPGPFPYFPPTIFVGTNSNIPSL